MNTQECSSTKDTPFRLVFGQNPAGDCQLIDLLYKAEIDNEDNIPEEDIEIVVNSLSEYEESDQNCDENNIQ
ncbi:332_t:CDS:1, partial [Ambispora gerdemannii]